jgi:pimeloyl-ACP methyl ester carboxylesterase
MTRADPPSPGDPASGAPVPVHPAAAALEARARRVETPCGDGRMVWRLWGQGPPLVLLHGGYGSWLHWIRTIPAFADRRTLCVPDLPGLGDSDEAAAPGGPPEIARAVADGLSALELPSAALDLVGFSFGGMIAGHVAAIRPVRMLTLVGAGGLGLPRVPIVLAREEPGMTAGQRREVHRGNLALLMLHDPAAIDDLAIAMQADNVARARVKSRRFSGGSALADALATARPRFLNAVWGARDATVGPYMPEREAFFRALRPDGTFTVIPDAGHWVAYEAAEAFNAVLGGLLEAAG